MTQSLPNPTVSAATASPDWATQTEEIHCPLCDYNLRGLTEPRCPECGYAFDWKQLLDPKERLHPYLFEHHSQRNIWSYVRTLIGSAFARKFWKSLHPMQPSRPRRLLIYWVIGVVVLLIPPIVMSIPYMEVFTQEVEYQRLQSRSWIARYPSDYAAVVQVYGSFDKFIDATSPRPTSRAGLAQVCRNLSNNPIVIVTVAYLAFPWVELLILMIFQQSMARARIRPVHFLRCLIYSCDTSLLLLLMIAPLIGSVALTYLQTFELLRFDRMFHQFTMFGAIALAAAWVVATWRLTIAFRTYLRFRDCLAVVIATEIIYFLALLILLANEMNVVNFFSMFGAW